MAGLYSGAIVRVAYWLLLALTWGGKSTSGGVGTKALMHQGTEVRKVDRSPAGHLSVIIGAPFLDAALVALQGRQYVSALQVRTPG